MGDATDKTREYVNELKNAADVLMKHLVRTKSPTIGILVKEDGQPAHGAVIAYIGPHAGSLLDILTDALGAPSGIIGCDSDGNITFDSRYDIPPTTETDKE